MCNGSGNDNGSGEWIKVDLGAVIKLHSFKLWNYNFVSEGSIHTGRGIKSANIYASVNPAAAGSSNFGDTTIWTNVLTGVMFNQATGSSDYTGEPPVMLTDVSARYVVIRVNSNFNDATSPVQLPGKFVGISEAQFFAEDNAVVAITGDVDFVTNPGSARIPGDVKLFGIASATALAYYGTFDGEENTNAWEHVVEVGEFANPGASFVAEIPVSPNQPIFYKLAARSSIGTMWSETRSDVDIFINDSAWSWQAALSVTNYAGAQLLTNFPLAVRLSEAALPGFLYETFARPADGGDLRFTDESGRELRFEIEKWDANGESLVWVKVPRIYPAGDGAPTKLKLYWGNPTANLPAYATNGLTWDSKFGAVFHLSKPADTDSSVRHLQGVSYNNVSSNAVLGTGQQFNGANARIVVPHHAAISSATLNKSNTISLWFKSDFPLPDGSKTQRRMLEKEDEYFIMTSTAEGKLSYLIKPSSTPVQHPNTISAGTWRHCAATQDSGKLRIFVDGEMTADLNFTDNMQATTLPLVIGSDYNTSSSSIIYFKGVLDEVRIENEARSADWIKACFDSQRHSQSFFGIATPRSVVKPTLLQVR